jgi:hypothetical protein
MGLGCFLIFPRQKLLKKYRRVVEKYEDYVGLSVPNRILQEHDRYTPHSAQYGHRTTIKLRPPA